MSQCLPYCEFRCLKHIDEFYVNSISENSLIGYILEADLKCPDELHYLYNDHPLAPENLAISYDTPLNYCKKIADKYGITVSAVKKLVPNLVNETNYVVHYRNLQKYLTLAMKLMPHHKIFKLNNLIG